MQKAVVSTVPKKDLTIVLPYLGKLSLQIRTRINRVMKNKLPHCNFQIVFQSECKLINFFTFKDKIPIFLFTGKRVKGDNDSAIQEHLFCNHSSGFDNFSILASNNNDFKVMLMESLLINRDHPPLNKNRQSLPLELFDDC